MSSLILTLIIFSNSCFENLRSFFGQTLIHISTSRKSSKRISSSLLMLKLSLDDYLTQVSTLNQAILINWLNKPSVHTFPSIFHSSLAIIPNGSFLMISITTCPQLIQFNWMLTSDSWNKYMNIRPKKTLKIVTTTNWLKC
jgi:hypothetical protein